MGDVSVPPTRCSVERCFADPGSIRRAGPGSAVQHFVPHRAWTRNLVPARDPHRGMNTSFVPVAPCGAPRLLSETRGWRAPGECRAVTPRKLGALYPSARRGDFLPSPSRRCTLSSGEKSLGLAAAGRSADGPAGNAPRAGLRIRSAGAPHPAPRCKTPHERAPSRAGMTSIIRQVRRAGISIFGQQARSRRKHPSLPVPGRAIACGRGERGGRHRPRRRV